MAAIGNRWLSSWKLSTLAVPDGIQPKTLNILFGKVVIGHIS